MNNQLQEFLDNYSTKRGPLLASTKREYIKSFTKFKELFHTDDYINLFTKRQDEVKEYIAKNYKSPYYLAKMYGFCTYYKIECPGKEPYTPKVFDDTVIDTTKIRNKLKNIKNLKARVWLSIHTDSSFNSLRRDWANTMIREYCTEDEIQLAPSLYTIETGEFNTEADNKTKRPRKFTLSDETRELIKEYIPTMKNNKYLFETSSNTFEKRNDTFSKYLRKISEDHIGHPVQTNAFRKGISTEDQTQIIKNGGSRQDQYDAAQKRGHSYAQEHSTYLGKVQEEMKEEIKEETPPKCIQESNVDINDKIMKLALAGISSDEIQRIIALLKGINS
jgi:integrase